nr:hypothetical protein [Trichocoleus desertorum]
MEYRGGRQTLVGAAIASKVDGNGLELQRLQNYSASLKNYWP